MSYRRLSTEELEALEQEFVHFLILNGVEAKDWLGLKEAQDNLVWQYIDQFSLMVWEKILKDIQYLDLIQEDSLSFFYFGLEEWHLLVAQVKGQSYERPMDLIQAEPLLAELLLETKGQYPLNNRDAFIYRLSQQQGYAISKGDWHRALKAFLEAGKN